MSVGKRVAQLRKERSLTQEALASRLYVTRQAVSRWETGESEPSIDMRKLIAHVFDVPVIELLDLPDEPACQCCGTPFSVPNMEHGKDADGKENPDYCKWCYDQGSFTAQGIDDLAEYNAPYLAAATGMSMEEAVSFMGAILPSLKRWSVVENKNVSAKVSRGKFYVCPDCGNIVWSMGEVVASCCGNSLSPLEASEADEAHSGTREVVDGCHLVTMNHPMTKEHYVTFIACVGDDLVRIKRLYPEQEAMASFFIQGPCKIYAHCNKHGLFRIE